MRFDGMLGGVFDPGGDAIFETCDFCGFVADLFPALFKF